MDLLVFSAEYAARNDVGEGYAAQLGWTIKAFSKHLGRSALLADLVSETINAFLGSLKAGDYAPETRRGRRRVLLSLATDAARRFLIPPLSRDMIAKVRTSPKLPDGLSWEQARAVIDCLQTRGGPHECWLRFRYRNSGIRRRDWWTAYLAACWDSGAPADVRLLKFSDIMPDGSVWRLRAKTGKLLRWHFSPFTMQSIAAIAGERELVFPLSGRLDLFRVDVRKILTEIAGLQGKSLGGFRSGAGTDAELRHGPGAGSQLLGNTPAVFTRHYEIQPVLQRPVLSPKPLMDEDACHGLREAKET